MMQKEMRNEKCLVCEKEDHCVMVLSCFHEVVCVDCSESGVGNRQSTAGHNDCMIFSAGHIYFQFVNFVFKKKQYHVANLLNFHAELFFAAKSETFARFLCHKT